MARWIAAIAVIALSTSGCQPDGLALDWRYQFVDDAQRVASSHVVARILVGGCSSARPIFSVGFARDDPSPATAPQLAAGRWGFEVVARDARCVEVGRGCRDVDLPDGSLGSVVVVLDAVSPADPVCAAASCDEGDCGEADVRPPDAAIPPRDSGSPDTGSPGCGICPAQNAFGHCEGATCVIDSCESGYRDCNAAPSDGCEAMCPDAPNIDPECYGGEGCVRGSCADGFSDCDGLVSNGCETEGRCRCPADGPCEFDCPNGCSVVCDRDCSVRCGDCTTCEVTCAAGTQCQMECQPGALTIFGGLPYEVSQECTLGETCP